MIDFTNTLVLHAETADAGRIRLGAAARRMPAMPTPIADSGKIRLGAAARRRIAG